MAWDGYYVYEGTEIINVARVQSYMETVCLAPWFRPVYEADGLPAALGVAEYVSPTVDGAPWLEPDNATSADFYGFYPLKIDGMEDSTRGATVTQSTRKGGQVGAVRLATREAVFSGVIIAASLSAADYGFRWLKAALSGDRCTPKGRSRGGELRYLRDAPPVRYPVVDGGAVVGVHGVQVMDGGGPSNTLLTPVDGGGVNAILQPLVEPVPEPWSEEDVAAEATLEALTRVARKVTVTGGPRVTGKRVTTNGVHLWQVQFTTTAADPIEYSLPRPMFVDVGLDQTRVAPPTLLAGVTLGPNPADPDEASLWGDLACPTPIWTPVYDPSCPPMQAPPTVPDVNLSCWTDPELWSRQWVTVPPTSIPRWDSAAPVLDVWAKNGDLRGLRVRFLPWDGTEWDTLINCDWVGDMLVTYLPHGYRLRIDAAAETITATDDSGITRAANSLVIGSDGKPFTWPSLSCDQPYLVALDTAIRLNNITPITSMSLIEKAAA